MNQANKPTQTEDEFNLMVERGTKAWEDIPNSTEWVESIRGNSVDNREGETYMGSLSDWFPIKTRVLSETDQTTIALLRSIIANIDAGNLTVLDRSGVQIDNATAELTLILNGHPDPTLRALTNS